MLRLLIVIIDKSDQLLENEHRKMFHTNDEKFNNLKDKRSYCEFK